MKMREKKDFTVTRMCFALAGMIFILLSMRTGDNSQSYLTMGLAFVAVANFLSCRKISFWKKNSEK